MTTDTGLERPVVTIDYTAQPKQALAHSTYVDELLYGGAAGGGKSRFARAEALAFALEVPGAAVLFLRRSFPDLNRADGPIRALLEEIPRELATYNATDHVWTFRNGSTIELGHLGRDADVIKYQGAAYQLLIFEEVTQFTEYQYLYLLSRLRNRPAVTDRMAALGYRPRAIATGNPGGIGHGWVKGRWIDPAPAGQPWRAEPDEVDPEPGTRCFIPARVDDNAYIDDDYRRRLNRLPDEERRMLKDGDWDVYSGQRFASFRRAIHVIDPEDLPLPAGAGVARGRGVDYGLDAPFACLWGAKLADDLVVIYREAYTAGLTPQEQADLILELEEPGESGPGREFPTFLDPACWARNPHVKAPKPTGRVVGNTGENLPPPGSIADTYRQALGAVRRADNDRLTGVARVAGKLRVRDDGLPRLLIYSTCRNLIRTLPALPRDPRRPEDVDTKAEDHAYDALRYLLAGIETSGPASTPPATGGSDHVDRSARARHAGGAPVTAGLGNRPL